MLIKRILLASVLLACAFVPLRAEDNAGACVAGDPFHWQEHPAVSGLPKLCQGIADASIGRRAKAERHLNSVIRQTPRSSSSYRAHEALTWMYFREGKYQRANAQLEQMIAENPGAEDAGSVHSLFAVLAQYPEQKVAKSRPSRVRSETIDNNLFVPVTINGVSGTYIADTGANISVLCESEARRLGLKVGETTTKMSDISGTPASISMRVTEAPDLWIGKTHLKHVAFDVVPDANEPFVDLPERHKGVLGIPVLIALGIFRIDSGNRVEILPASAETSEGRVPLAFDGAMPVTRVVVSGKTLSFTFDTGADRTYLYPPFAAEFPELTREGSKQSSTMTGFSGSKAHESVVLPSVNLSLGKAVTLAPATVFLKTSSDASEWAAGNLGFDLISQAIPITIDFQTMRLIVEAP
ncbi:MAG: aspartyl protease family protein [Terracidiphilus sp.]|jgi:predicted aspartyl protease